MRRYARFGVPIIAMRMSTFLLFLMLHIYLGRLGVTQLSAGLLGFTVFRATVISTLLSMTSALNTIGGQVLTRTCFEACECYVSLFLRYAKEQAINTPNQLRMCTHSFVEQQL